MIKWIDANSALTVGGNLFSNGDEISDGILTADQIAFFKKSGQLDDGTASTKSTKATSTDSTDKSSS